MSKILEKYAQVVGSDVIEHLRQLAKPLKGLHVLHLNSTKVGGGVALRIRYLLHNLDEMQEMGRKAREFVEDNFLITRHIREYLTLIFALIQGKKDRIELF